MRRSICLFLAAVSLIVTLAAVEPAARPRYGGTLRAEIAAVIRTLDPAEWPASGAEAAAKEKLIPLIFERLVQFDDNGQPRSALALSWQHDATKKRWEFALRSGVKFHDGSLLTPAAVAGVLTSRSQQWRVSAVGDAVVIESDHPVPELLSALAQVRCSIFVREPNGNTCGTGAFRIGEWQSGKRAVFAANEEHWGGRPFLDFVAVQMARPLRDQWLDLELGRADFVEISPSEVSRAAQRKTKIWSTAPTELMALVFEGSRALANARLREAVAFSIDRAAIHQVLLQKQGEPTGALLPQWLSGYAFLMPRIHDSQAARKLASAFSSAAPLAFTYDAADMLARAVAERIAVNSREAGITLQVSGQGGRAQATSPDMRLVRLRIGSGQPQQVLSDIAVSLRLSERLPLGNSSTLEAVYEAERALLGDFRVLPLFHLPEPCAVSPKVKTRMMAGIDRTGGWRFEDVWLDPEEP